MSDPHSRRRPSAGLIVSALALVLAASGASTALPGKHTVKASDLAKNSVTSKAIKKNAVTSKAIKKSAVKSADLSDNAVRGSTVKDGSLSAADLGDLAISSKNGVVIPATSGVDQDTAREAAPERVLLTAGPLTFYGKCYTDTTAGDTYAAVFVRTTAADVLVSTGNGDTHDGGGDFLQPDTAEAERFLIDESASGTGDSDSARSMNTVMAGSDYLTVFSSLFVQRADPLVDSGPYGAGNRCIFGATLVG